MPNDMKKNSVVRATIKPTSKSPVMKNYHGDQIRSKEYCVTDSDCMVESQAQYIENLQQQIYVLENEIGYLRTYLQESNKQHPSMVAEGEKMVKKLAESHSENEGLKVEIKRKQTTIDLVRSEKDRFQRYQEEFEEKYRKEKCKLLENIITYQRERDSLQDKTCELDQLIVEQKENIRNLKEDLGHLKVELDQIKQEELHDKELICSLQEEKENMQKLIYELKMKEELKSSKDSPEAIQSLKEKIEELFEVCETSKRMAGHEKLLREKMSEDNSQLIKRYAEQEAELADVKAQLRKEQSMRSSLEQIHLKTTLETAEIKSRDHMLNEEIQQLKSHLKEQSEQCFKLSIQLSDEQRLKSREEEKILHLQQRFDQLEIQCKTHDKDNIELARDNTYLKDQILHLKQQIKCRDDEVLKLKQKVQEMQISVEEFIQSNQAAKRHVGERWKQLCQLAQGIQALTSAAEPNS